MNAKPDDRERLKHIIEAIDRIKKFTQGMSYQDFSKDEVTQFAIIKNFEIIGEASYHLTDELRKANPAVEWRKIMAFRHILVHDYYQINLEIVWKAKENKLEELNGQIKNIMEKISSTY